MAKILIVDGGVPFHGVGGTLNTGSAGKVQNVIMTVTSDNFGNCIVGDGNVTPSGCYYWNGQE